MNIKKILSDIGKSISVAWNTLTGQARKTLPLAIQLVENMQNYYDDGTVDVLTKIIPGQTDNRLAEEVRKLLPDLLIDLHLTNDCLHAGDTNAIIQCGIRTLQNSSKDAKKILTHGIAVKLVEVFSDGKVTWSEGVGLAEYIFQYIFKRRPAVAA